MLRVVCDTNVLVSAFIAAGPPSRVVEEIVAGRLELVLPDPVLRELRRVLVEKLGFDDRRWREVEDLLTALASEVVTPPVAAPEPRTGDPDDDIILACAATARADVLISGDRRHLLPAGEHRGVRILTPQATLAELRA